MLTLLLLYSIFFIKNPKIICYIQILKIIVVNKLTIYE